MEDNLNGQGHSLWGGQARKSIDEAVRRANERCDEIINEGLEVLDEHMRSFERDKSGIVE